MCNLFICVCSFPIADDLRINFILFYQVEEIDDVDGNSCDPFVAAAIENEKELDLSEEQKKNFRKVINSSGLDIKETFSSCYLNPHID